MFKMYNLYVFSYNKLGVFSYELNVFILILKTLL